MIFVDRVSYEYSRGQVALRDVSITIDEGSVTAVIGTNGSGKSTLARLMTGLLIPTRGTVQVDGLDTRASDPRLVRSKATLAWQNSDNQLVCGVVADDIAFGPENLGLAPSEIERRVNEVARVLGLDRVRDETVHTLSSARKQVLAVAGAMAMYPRYLILDEVTARLDPVAAGHLLDSVLGWAKERGTAVIAITHVMSEVSRADRVLWLDSSAANSGQAARLGEPAAILAEFDAGAPVDSALFDTVSTLRQRGVRTGGPVDTVEALVEQLCRL